MVCIKTERLNLREWTSADVHSFAAMNQDPRVMAHYPRLLTKEESAESVEKIRTHFKKHGFCFYACELAATHEFMGFIGLKATEFSTHFTPCVEIGWRLAYDFWGKGYATEGAKAVLKTAFETFNIKEVVSFTSPLNVRSVQVMKRLGMAHDAEGTFENPKVPEGHMLRPHVLYRMPRALFENTLHQIPNIQEERLVRVNS